MIGLSHRKQRIIKKTLFMILLVLVFLFLIYSIFYYFNWLDDNKNIKNIMDDINENVSIEIPTNESVVENINPPESLKNDYWDYIKMDLLNVNFDELIEKNSETVAWIQVNGTNINYPVVQTNNNDYYLNHAYDKTYNQAGWIFADYRNNMKNFGYNTIIYGHSRLDTTMFGSLKNILNSNWYNDKNNHVIKVSTPEENTLWQIFSVYTINNETYYLSSHFNTTKEYENFLNTMKGRSLVDFSGEVNKDDKVLTLSTCKNNFGQRVVMHAKLIKKEIR